MSTHANIFIETEKGNCRGVYVHFDGYLDGVGKCLLTNYKTYQMVNDLINLGDLKSVGKNIDDKRTIAFSRDYGESLKIREVKNFFELSDESRKDDLILEYTYLFMGGEWYYMNMGTKEWCRLDEILASK